MDSEWGPPAAMEMLLPQAAVGLHLGPLAGFKQVHLFQRAVEVELVLLAVGRRMHGLPSLGL